MPKIDTMEQSWFSSVCYRVRTPSGTMFVHIMENKSGDPVGLQINIGKAGSELLAWAYATARLCSLVLDRGGTIRDLVMELSEIHTDKTVTEPNGVVIRSGIQGLEHVLSQYHREKYGQRIFTNRTLTRLGA